MPPSLNIQTCEPAAIRPGAVHNTKALGQIIYTDYIYLFQLAGLILLVAMVGAITLTLRRRSGVRTQIIADQNSRTREETVKLAKVVTGAGVRGGNEIMAEITLAHYLAVAAILFVFGVFGIFINRKNVITILMSIELILLSVSINLVAFSAFSSDLSGQIFSLFILTVAAAEAAIGLAILVVYFRNRGSISVEDINVMKG